MLCKKCNSRLNVCETVNSLDNEVYRRRKCSVCGNIVCTIEKEADNNLRFRLEWNELRKNKSNMKGC